MAQRKLQEFDEYRYGPRSVLKSGDQFRVGGGPVYVTDDGVEHVVAERGTFKFRRYCEQGAQKWIEAYTADGSCMVTLYVGKPCKSPTVPNLKRKPYKIRKVTDRKRKPKKSKLTDGDSAPAHRQATERPVQVRRGFGRIGPCMTACPHLWVTKPPFGDRAGILYGRRRAHQLRCAAEGEDPYGQNLGRMQTIITTGSTSLPAT